MARIHGEGHVLGNHSYWHGKLFDLQSPAAIRAELEHTNAAVQEIIHKRPRFFRPPYGVTNPMVATAVRKLSYTTIGWSLRSFDSVSNDGGRLMSQNYPTSSGPAISCCFTITAKPPSACCRSF